MKGAKPGCISRLARLTGHKMAKIKKTTKSVKKIVEFNVNLSCYPKLHTDDRGCRLCEKFLFCERQEKWEDFEFPRMELIRKNLGQFRYKIAIMAGKGGVGKSTLTASIAQILAISGYRVTVIDQDFDGPCIPMMLGVQGQMLYNTSNGIEPVVNEQGIQVISTAFFQEVPVFTRYHQGRQELLEEFLARTNFGQRDFLLVDLPAGTSSDTVNILEYIRDLDGAIVVTVPSEVSVGVASRAGNLCRKVGCRILGVVENMSGYICRHCGGQNQIISEGGGEVLAGYLGVPLLGQVPLDGMVAKCIDEGKAIFQAFPESRSALILNKIVENLKSILLSGEVSHEKS